MNRIVLILLLPFMISSCSRAPKADRPPPNVTTAIIDQRDVPIYVDAIGQAIPPVTVQIKPQVAGKLIETSITQGAIVEKGQVIYKMDPRPYIALLDQAKAQLVHDIALLQYAEKTVERYKPVVEDDFIAKLTFEQYVSTAEAAKAQVKLDMAAVRAAQINVDFTSVVAPVAGKISFFAVDVGNILALDDPTAITTIRPFSPINISFSLPQQQLEMIRRVQGNEGKWEFIATLPERPENPFKGTTFFIDNQVDQNTGTILLKGEIPNGDREFWPGEFVRVQVLHQIAKNALVVPPGAVLMGKNGPYVYTVDKEGKASAYNVKVLARTNEYSAITSQELHGGDIVITDGQINIAQGMKVQATLKQ